MNQTHTSHYSLKGSRRTSVHLVMRGQECEVRLWWRLECILVGKLDAQKSQYSFKDGIGYKHLQYVDDDGLRQLRCDYGGGQSVVFLLKNLVRRNLITGTRMAEDIRMCNLLMTMV